MQSTVEKAKEFCFCWEYRSIGLKEKCPVCQLANTLGETNEALAACQSEAAPMLQDAARYRWIRQHNKVGGKVTVLLECNPPELCTSDVGHKPHELDAAIDAAMTADRESAAP